MLEFLFSLFGSRKEIQKENFWENSVKIFSYRLEVFFPPQEAVILRKKGEKKFLELSQPNKKKKNFSNFLLDILIAARK